MFLGKQFQKALEASEEAKAKSQYIIAQPTAAGNRDQSR